MIRLLLRLPDSIYRSCQGHTDDRLHGAAVHLVSLGVASQDTTRLAASHMMSKSVHLLNRCLCLSHELFHVKDDFQPAFFLSILTRFPLVLAYPIIYVLIQLNPSSPTTPASYQDRQQYEAV